ncbi:MAG: helix-turn-helix domain-containing protein [bacterium]
MAPKRATALELWGKEFARAREDAGLSQSVLAKDAYLSQSLIGMWETGQRTPKSADLERCEERLGSNGRLAWSLANWVPREVAHEWLDKWIWIEENARQLLSFETTVVPGLLQTEEYTRVVLRDEGQVSRRLERQGILDSESPPMLIVVLAQSVLSQQVGDAKTMHDQLQHLLNMAEHENVIVHIVPPDARACAIFTGPFVIASFDEGNEAAYVDDQLRGRVVEHPEDIAMLRRTFELIRGDALSGRQSTDFIREAMEQWKPE